MNTYTPKEVAAVLKVKYATVMTWARQEKLTGSRTPAGWRFTDDDIKQFLSSQRPTRKAETAS